MAALAVELTVVFTVISVPLDHNTCVTLPYCPFVILSEPVFAIKVDVPLKLSMLIVKPVVSPVNKLFHITGESVPSPFLSD